MANIFMKGMQKSFLHFNCENTKTQEEQTNKNAINSYKNAKIEGRRRRERKRHSESKPNNRT